MCTMSSLFKAVDAGEEELGNGDLALLVRRFPAVNDLTVRFASRLTSAYEVLSQVPEDCISQKVRIQLVVCTGSIWSRPDAVCLPCIRLPERLCS